MNKSNPDLNHYNPKQDYPEDEFDELVRIYRFSDIFTESYFTDIFGIKASKRIKELTRVYELPYEDYLLVINAAEVLDKSSEFTPFGQKIFKNAYTQLKEKFILSQKLSGLNKKINELGSL